MQKVLILNNEPKKNTDFIAKPQVLQSAAGYYIGTLTEQGCPLDRYSDYYPSEEAAFEDMPFYGKSENQVSYFLRDPSFPGVNE